MSSLPGAMGGDETAKSGENANGQQSGAMQGREHAVRGWKARARTAEDDDAGVMRAGVGAAVGKRKVEEGTPSCSFGKQVLYRKMVIVEAHDV